MTPPEFLSPCETNTDVAKEVFSSESFEAKEEIYRLYHGKNPLTSENRLTNYSCKWQRLIEAKQISQHLEHLGLGDAVAITTAKEIINFQLVERKETGGNCGEHKVFLKLKHSPKPCDYSNVEVLVVHKFPNAEDPEKEEEKVYAQEEWEHVMLSKDSKQFYKKLRQKYREYLANLFFMKFYCFWRGMGRARVPCEGYPAIDARDKQFLSKDGS